MKGPPDSIKDEKPPEVVLEPLYHQGGHASNILYDDAVDGLIVERSENGVRESNDLLENYSWMVDEDEFNKQVMEQMEQEHYMETCFEEMWREEASVGPVPSAELNNFSRRSDNNLRTGIENSMGKLAVTDSNILVSQVCLNPNAMEFIPRSNNYR